MFSLKNKKQNKAVFALALFLFSSGVFFLTASGTHAAWGLDFLILPITGILYYIVFVPISWFASVAITLFEWAIKPEYMSGDAGLLNRASVYTMWKFIRDFFNLFFILTLLYTAFTIIFQVAKDYKKTLLSLVLAALFVNFSFPITRVIIDVTNVPMYYFVNKLAATKDGKKTLGSVLSASQLEKILVPHYENGSVKLMGDGVLSQLIMAIVFMFIFSITLLVLAVMFVIRLAALIILLIFSSVGFAASVIPGMEKYGKDWWNYLAKYTLFGPAAMLMLVVATNFFGEISQDNTAKQFLEVGTTNGTAESASFISSMAMFTIPIVMLWMAIGLAVSSSLIGAGAVVGLGKSVLKGAGKKFSGYNAAARRVGAFNSEMKKRSDAKFTATNFGTRLGQRLGLKMDEINARRVGTKAETRGARHDASAAEEGQKREIAAAATNYRINDRTSASELQRLRDQAHESGDMALLAATVNQMAKKEGTAEDISSADKAAINDHYKDIGGVDNAAKTENSEALKKHRADLAYTTASERDAAFQRGDIKLDTQSTKSLLALKDSAIKNGKYTQQMLAEMKKADPGKAKAFIDQNADIAISDLETRYQAALTLAATPGGAPVPDSLKRERAAAQQAHLYATGDFHSSVTTDDQKREVLQRADHETLSEMAKNPARLTANISLVAEASGPGKTAAILAKLTEEGKNIQDAVDEIERVAALPSTLTGPLSPAQTKTSDAAQSVVDRMKGDYRFKGIVSP